MSQLFSKPSILIHLKKRKKQALRSLFHVKSVHTVLGKSATFCYFSKIRLDWMLLFVQFLKPIHLTMN